MATSARQPAVGMHHLRLVSAIAEHGSMTIAGRALGLTQPALSHQLRELETKLRSPLFVRTARRMVPTAAGERLMEIARGVLPQIDSFESQVLNNELASVHATVRIATECYTAYHWLPSVLRTFRERWPNVELRVKADYTPSPIAALREGSLDFALVYTRAADKRVRLERLFDDELVVIVAPDHQLAGKPFVDVSELADEHLFVYTSPEHRSSVLRDILEPAGVQPARITRIQLTEAIVELVAAGLGVAVLAKWAVRPAVQSGDVCALRLGRSGYIRSWYSAVRSDEVSPPHQFDLIDLLRRSLADGPSVRTRALRAGNAD
jgi:LysR family transcriptional regulator for metE and metH